MFELPEKDESKLLLKQIRDLLTLQSRQAGVPVEAIGRVLDLSPKSVRNQYPLGKNKGEPTSEVDAPETSEPAPKKESASGT